jgi:hypothetical protein
MGVVPSDQILKTRGRLKLYGHELDRENLELESYFPLIFPLEALTNA